MLSSKLDWLTLSIKPDGSKPDIDFDFFLHVLTNLLHLERLISLAKKKGRRGNYDCVYSYEGVEIMLPSADTFATQGACISISSEGLNYFSGYLWEMGFTLREWLGAFRGLCTQGYITRCTRFDYAFDDITPVGEDSIISMERVLSALVEGECCMKARSWSDDGDNFKSRMKRRMKKVNGDSVQGLTVSIGTRLSETYCRFYDKKAEQLQCNNGAKIPENTKAWTRFEMEFKGGNAMAVMNAFLDYSEADFIDYIRGVALNYVRFVERTSNNVTRCVTKRWWKAFLNGASKAFQLPKYAPARSASVKWSKWFKKSIFPSLNTARKYIDDDNAFLSWLDTVELELESNKKKVMRSDLLNCFEDGAQFYDYVSAFQEWENCTDDLADDFRATVESLRFLYLRKHWDYLFGDPQLKLE